MNVLDEIVSTQERGESRGIASICSAHPAVLEAVLTQGKASDSPVLIEATCNQVNQFGGYTGMRPKDFVQFVSELAERLKFPRQKLILGGDHLGPNPWQAEPAALAMEKSKVLVQEYVQAGFTKIHLDASMKLRDDPAGPLLVEVAAGRAAELAAVAEAAFQQRGMGEAPRYVIGTEVPIAGGAQRVEEELKVTAVSDLTESLEKSRAAFVSRGLESAWERVVAVVVQPGVEYGDASIHEYERGAAAELTHFIEGQPFVYEAHSTDYQTQFALRQMVADHFAILKVGPALTFAYREAIFALAQIERELFPAEECSNLMAVLDGAMLSNPVHWQKYYHGDETAQAFARKYSFSDRSRYYWLVGAVQGSLARLFSNLSQRAMPLTLLSQVLPKQYHKIRNGEIENQPQAIIHDKILEVVGSYPS